MHRGSAITLYILIACACSSLCQLTDQGDADDGNVNVFDVIAQVNKKAEEKLKKQGRILSDAGGGRVIHGDINVFRDDPYLDKQHSPGRKAYGVLSWPRKLWRTRVIPYEIRHSGTSKLSSYQARQKILAGIKEIERVSCLKFRPYIRGKDSNWLLYVRGSGGCLSGIGRRSNKNTPTTINLGEPCVNHGIIIHETLHGLGFYHEQCRRDRDNYVKIYLGKVIPSMRHNFDKYKPYESDAFGLDYDHKSIMHYSRTTFTMDGSNTIEGKYDPNRMLGGNKLSQLDIRKINAAYHCHDLNKIWTEWSDWSVCVRDWSGTCKRSKHRICLVEDLRRCPTANEYGVEAIVQPCSPPLSCTSDNAVDGYFGNWGSWSSCSANCGFGKRTRQRPCYPPRNGGNPCAGDARETELCRLKRCGARRSLDATFDSGMGPWKNKPGNQFNWQLGMGKTASVNTGPRADHTTGRGRYVYVSSRNFLRNGKKAVLMSSLAGTRAGPKCLRFYYMMNGKGMGSLDVYLKETVTKQYRILMNKKGHQSNRWLAAAFTIPKLNNYFNVFFEATIGYSPDSDIAIDDIYLDQTPCPLGANGCADHNKSCEFWARNGECQKNSIWMIQACCLACRGR